MKVEQSQLEYLKKRKGDYNLKYGILNKVIKENLNKDMKILETCGGVGLTTALIQRIKPKQHVVFEIDQECIKILKRKFEDIEVEFQDFLKYQSYDKFDFIFIDGNAFTLKQPWIYELFNLLKGIKGSLVLTYTGNYSLTFIKKPLRDYKNHFKKLNEFLNEYDFSIEKVYFVDKFSIVTIKQGLRQEFSIENYKDKNFVEWREFL